MNKLSTSFTCFVCTDDFDDHPIIIDDSELCGDCLKQIFETAITSEASYPPRWGEQVLDPWDFLRYKVYDTTFLKLFEDKAREFACPGGERAYCANTIRGTQGDRPCSRFVGRKTREREYVKCKDCGWYTCLRCRAAFECPTTTAPDDAGYLDPGKHHRCDRSRHKGARSKDPFEGLQRGKDYQICPNKACKQPCELRDGCNHMTCSCKTEFCFICGRVATGASMHWGGDGCPRFGQPGATGTIWNAEPGFAMEHDAMDEFLAWHMGLLELLARGVGGDAARAADDTPAAAWETGAHRHWHRHFGTFEVGEEIEEQPTVNPFEHRRRRRRRTSPHRSSEHRRTGDSGRGVRSEGFYHAGTAATSLEDVLEERRPGRHRTRRRRHHSRSPSAEREERMPRRRGPDHPVTAVAALAALAGRVALSRWRRHRREG